MQDDQQKRWQRLKKTSFNKKDLSQRMRRVEGVTVRHARKFVVKRWSSAREVRRRIITWVVATGLLISAAGLQLMWNQQSYRTNTVASNGTYAEAVLGPIDTLNPLFASTRADESASQLLFSRLFAYDTKGQLNGDLATKFAVNDKGTVYTVTIRSDARWHDGIKLTAKDVAFTINLLKNPSVGTTNREDWRGISVSVIDDNTLSFTLPAIIAAFPHALTFPIIPEHILGKVEPNAIRENDFGRSPIGSGPFKLRFVQDVDVNAGRKIVHLARSSNYYRGATKLEFFQLHVYDTQDAIVRALSIDEVNSASGLLATNTGRINKSRYEVETVPIKSGVYAFLNTTREFLKDKAIRQALQVGTNTKAILDQLPAGTPTLDLPFINGQLSGDLPKVATYNLKNAQKILDDAGWVRDGATRKKDGRELKLTVVTIKNSDHERVLETLVGQWRDLGIAVDTQVVDQSDPAQRVIQDILQPRNYDVLLYQLAIGSDPDVYAYWHSLQASSRGLNFSNYSNPISDDALVSARSRLEPALRNAKYLTFARQWVSDVPAIGLYQSTTQYVHSKTATAFKSSNVLVSPIDRYSDILYWSVGSRSVYKTP
ncbi:peptide ABC transporter substrate-binding protein [Candidatus Saccharibacteria bacterium]|nr:peptide ABC transporter substrate-binding protein [Candidatus Saccharibacteria bacterium]